MSDQPTLNTERFDALMSDVLEDVADFEQVELFNACLRQDPEARLRYIAYIDLHAALADPAGPLKDPAPDDLPDIMSEIVDQALALRRQHEIEDEANRQLTKQQAEDARERRFELRRRAEPTPVKQTVVIPQVVFWLGLAAVLGIAATVAFEINRPAPQSTAPTVAEEAPVQPQSPPRTAQTPTHAPSPVASLHRASGVTWGETLPNGQSARATQPGTRLLPGEYTLESGVVELVFDQDAAVIVEAPATFKLTGTNSLSLASGKLVANVPPSAYGFTVRAPGMNVVDLGTEFALSVRPGRGDNATDASTQVQVFTGQVRVAPNDSDGLGFPEEMVQAGESRQTQADGQSLLAGRATPHTFYRSVPDSYERMVRSMDPVAYWRFEDGDGQAFTDRVGHGGGEVETAGAVTAIHDAPVGSGAQFTGDGLLALRSPTGLDLTRDYTLALWVRMDPGEMKRQRFVGNPRFVQGIGTSGFGLGVIPDVQSGGYHPLFTHYGVSDYTTDLALTVGRWHHLAVTIDSRGEPTFYLDGRPAGARQMPNARGRTGPAPGRANNADLIIGQPIDPEHFDEDELRAIPFRGGLDELVIYPTVLSVDQIAELARTGPHGDGGD